MGIYLPNMEMPKNCTGCPICCGLPYQHRDVKGRRLDCPLIEIPTPHGRLGDLDELKTAFPRCDNSMDIKIASVRATINHAPTIIEAEGET